MRATETIRAKFEKKNAKTSQSNAIKDQVKEDEVAKVKLEPVERASMPSHEDLALEVGVKRDCSPSP